MLFNSFQFLIFFVVVTSLYFAFPYKKRWLLLLISSCYFYMAFVPVYILILGFTIVVDYFAGIYIEKAVGKRRKMFLIFSLIANIGVLAFFKYYNFLNLNFTYTLREFGLTNPIPYLSILLPIGLSFHTFQAMSYTIEVYRRHQKAERHFGIYALYVMFYPQLVAGPIERPQNLLHQFTEKYDFNYDRVTSGLRLIGWGLFKKVVIADRLGIIVDAVYNHSHEYNSISLSIATVFFLIQLYCDFSAYSDIAIGTARVMGFKLMMNFDMPFISTNVTDFWRRWHISLSTWLRDYLYNPLSIATRYWGMRGVIFSLLCTFLIVGLWHGAGWNFVIFGGLQGIALCYDALTKKVRKKISKSINKTLYNSISIILTFSYQCFSVIFFRANHLHSAIYIVKRIFTGWGEILHKLFNHQPVIESLGVNKTRWDLLLPIVLILFLEIVHYVQRRKDISELFMQKPVYIRWAVYYGFVFAILFLGVFENRQFIYFQF